MTPKPETVLPMLAVYSWKHDELVRAQAAILHVALRLPLFCAGDVPEDTVAAANRQGVASNAWNALRAVGIIERVPMSLTDPTAGIYGGRKENKNAGAKGRWVAVYRLVSRPLAESWLRRHGLPLEPDAAPVQEEMQLA